LIQQGFVPITDINMDGALQVKENMAKLPEDERIEV